MSYTILVPPAIKNGRENAKLDGSESKNKPFIANPTVRPTDRAMFVIPLAADLSPLLTINATYVCLAGTSIWLIQNLHTNRIIATEEFGAKGINSKKTLEGRWVNIIVARAPILSTIFDERIPLIPLIMLQTKSKPPILLKSRLNFC